MASQSNLLFGREEGLCWYCISPQSEETGGMSYRRMGHCNGWNGINGTELNMWFPNV
jgi:hypothetical protein